MLAPQGIRSAVGQAQENRRQPLDTRLVLKAETRNITYKVATIQIDLLDGKDGKLVWRGSDEQMMASTPNPQDRSDAIRSTVTKILSNYPPH